MLSRKFMHSHCISHDIEHDQYVLAGNLVVKMCYVCRGKTTVCPYGSNDEPVLVEDVMII
jgi:hypothetical protein